MVHHLAIALATARLEILFAVLAIGFASMQTSVGEDASIDESEVSQTVGAETYEEVYEGPIEESFSMETQPGEPFEALSTDVVEENFEVCSNATQSCPGVCRDPGHPAKPKRKLPGDIDEGDCPSKRYRMDDCQRTGDPNCIYLWAAPSITDKYSAWYAGGGAAFKGRGRTAEEGTWGLDYDGVFGHARTWMKYTRGKFQGGEGAYEGEHVPLKKKLHAGR